ncbi:MAG: molybdopterin cofactor-binding domain-containing protein [Caulobacterales bacterium]|jgi:isoquinoline 1-oxidoreductase beta subunit
MTKHTDLSLSRRGFLLTSAVVAGGFAVGCSPASGAKGGAGAVFNPFVRIDAEGVVTVIAKHIEFGQGTHTGLAAIVAEELDADWSKVKAEAAPADLDVYYNTFFGKGNMGTGGSSAIANSWPQYRAAAAGARAMLVEAAAKKLGVAASDLTVKDGVISAGDKKATFAELAGAAAKLKPPVEPKLKDAAQFTLIGTDRVRRLDNGEKTTGKAIFTIDKKPDGERTALIARAPKFGAAVKSFDAAEAKKVPGVVNVVQVPSGVAVVAKDFWSAKKGRDALKVEWDFAKAETRSSAQLFDEFRKLAATPGPEKVQSKGDAGAAMKKAARVVKGTFEFPYLAHATMEPMNAIAQIKDGAVHVWTGSQFPSIDKPTAAGIAGVDPSKVTIDTLMTGGSFGRRANFQADFVADAVAVAKAMGDGQPVLVQWTREDDMTGGKYRPMVVHHVEAGLDKAGNIVAWKHVIVSQPVLAGTPFNPPGQPDGSVVEGAHKSPYLETVADHDITAHYAQVGVPVLWWRSVGHTHTAHAMEHMIDLCAGAARKDPVAYRRQLLAKAPRHLGALNLAVEKSGYPKSLGRGHSLGVAVHESFGSVVAMVADVTMAGGAPKVHRVTVAVDCGIAVSPNQIAAQMEGGLGYGLGAALYDQITLTNGEVDQKNFDTYPSLRISDMPAVDTHIVPSTNPPSGVGEPGTPPIAPAVANAVLAATGKATFKLPFKPA